LKLVASILCLATTALANKYRNVTLFTQDLNKMYYAKM